MKNNNFNKMKIIILIKFIKIVIILILVLNQIEFNNNNNILIRKYRKFKQKINHLLYTNKNLEVLIIALMILKIKILSNERVC